MYAAYYILFNPLPCFEQNVADSGIIFLFYIVNLGALISLSRSRYEKAKYGTKFWLNIQQISLHLARSLACSPSRPTHHSFHSLSLTLEFALSITSKIFHIRMGAAKLIIENRRRHYLARISNLTVAMLSPVCWRSKISNREK